MGVAKRFAIYCFYEFAVFNHFFINKSRATIL